MTRLFPLLALLMAFLLTGCASMGWEVLNNTYKVTTTNNDEMIFSKILQKARKADKPILLDFYTDWCRSCIQMDKESFNTGKVTKFYSKNFVNFKVNAEAFDGMGLAQRFAIKGFPTIVFLDQDGNVIHRAEGFRSQYDLMRDGNAALARTGAGESEYLWE